MAQQSTNATALRLAGKKIFISYSHHDRRFVQRLARRLEIAGLHVWWAEWEIKVGDSITQKVSEGIKESAYLAVVLSPNSIQSNWVQRELGSALMRQLSTDRKITILPLLIADCEVPVLLQDIKYADFRTSYDKGFQELLEGVLPKLLETHLVSPVEQLSSVPLLPSHPDSSVPQTQPVHVERYQRQARLLQMFRDPIWQVIGAVVGIVALFVTIWMTFQPGTNSIVPTTTPTFESTCPDDIVQVIRQEIPMGPNVKQSWWPDRNVCFAYSYDLATGAQKTMVCLRDLKPTCISQELEPVDFVLAFYERLPMYDTDLREWMAIDLQKAYLVGDAAKFRCLADPRLTKVITQAVDVSPTIGNPLQINQQGFSITNTVTVESLCILDVSGREVRQASFVTWLVRFDWNVDSPKGIWKIVNATAK